MLKYPMAAIDQSKFTFNHIEPDVLDTNGEVDLEKVARIEQAIATHTAKGGTVIPVLLDAVKLVKGLTAPKQGK